MLFTLNKCAPYILEHVTKWPHDFVVVVDDIYLRGEMRSLHCPTNSAWTLTNSARLQQTLAV